MGQDYFSEQERKNAISKMHERTEFLNDMAEKNRKFTVDFEYSRLNKNKVFDNLQPGEDIYTSGYAEQEKEFRKPGNFMLGDDYYRGITSRIPFELSFARYMKMPEEYIYSNTPEAMEAKSKMGEVFEKIFMDDPKSSPETRAAKQETAGRVLAQMYKNNAKNFDYRSMGDLGDEDNLFSHAQELSFQNPVQLAQSLKTEPQSFLKGFFEEMGFLKTKPNPGQQFDKNSMAEEKAEIDKAEIDMKNDRTLNDSGNIGLNYLYNTIMNLYPSRFNFSVRNNPEYGKSTVSFDGLLAEDQENIAAVNAARYALKKISTGSEPEDKIGFTDKEMVNLQGNILNAPDSQLIADLYKSDTPMADYQKKLMLNAALPGSKGPVVAFTGNMRESLDNRRTIDIASQMRREFAEQTGLFKDLTVPAEDAELDLSESEKPAENAVRYTRRQQIFRAGIVHKLYESGMPVELAQALTVAAGDKIGQNGKITQEAGQKYAEEQIKKAGGDSNLLCRNITEELMAQTKNLGKKTLKQNVFTDNESLRDYTHRMNLDQSLDMIRDNNPKVYYTALEDLNARGSVERNHELYRNAFSAFSFQQLKNGVREQDIVLQPYELKDKETAMVHKDEQDPVRIEYTKFKNTPEVDPMELRDAYKTLDFTGDQLENTEMTYKLGFGNNFCGQTADVMRSNGLNEFDCIFINGKPVSQIYKDKMNAGGQKAFDEEPAESDRKVMQAMVVSAGLYGANTITYTKPIPGENGELNFSVPQEVKRSVSKTAPIEAPREGTWHWIRHFGTESWENKFERAASNRSQAVERSQDYLRQYMIKDREVKAAEKKANENKKEEKPTTEAESRKQTSFSEIKEAEEKKQKTFSMQENKKEKEEPAKTGEGLKKKNGLHQ